MGGIDDEIRSIVVQPVAEGGGIVVGGFSNGDFALARYNRTNGTLDTTFGTSGKTLTSFGSLEDRAFNLVRQADGKIVAAGYTTVNVNNRDFAVARYFGPDVPEITVQGASADILDGDTTPSTLEGTDYGTVNQGSPPVSQTFTIRNDGSATLTMSGLSVPAGFTVVDGLASSLAPGTSDSLIIQLNTTAVGTRSGDVSFSTNDPDETAFNFRIQGTVAVVSGPEVTVLGNATEHCGWRYDAGHFGWNRLWQCNGWRRGGGAFVYDTQRRQLDADAEWADGADWVHGDGWARGEFGGRCFRYDHGAAGYGFERHEERRYQLFHKRYR